MYTRYPGAQPFSTQQHPIFFGREQELDELFRFVQSEQLVVLYAKSGLGKSSLLNAGLIPLVEKEGNLEPISIRFGAYTENNTSSPLSWSARSIRKNVPDGVPVLESLKPADENSLWYHLKTRQLSTNKHRFLLVFDQFEELFTYPDEDIQDFSKELSEVLYTTIPDRFRQELEQRLQGAGKKLPEEDMKELHQPFELRIVMAIRSDRMSLMNKLKHFLANILENCYELRPLTIQEAESAILSPAYLPKESGPFKSPVFDYEDEAVASLIGFLSEDRTQPIESFQLQILCEYVEREIVLNQGRKLIVQADIAKPDLILENYYLGKIKGLPKEDQLPARRLIEEGLVFEEEERRLTLYGGQITRTYGISAELLETLLDTHLIRSEPSLKGGYTYELSHDTLVAPVLKAKTKRVKAEQIAAEQEAQLRKEQEMKALREQAEEERMLREKAEKAQAEAEEQRQISDQRLRTVRGLLLAAMVAIILAGYFWSNARSEKEQANKEREKAEFLLTENIRQDSLNRIERYNRHLAEAQRYQNEGSYELAIGQYEIAKDFTIDTLPIIQAIENCTKSAENRLAYAELTEEAATQISNNQYKEAVATFEAAVDLGVNTLDLRLKLSNLKSILQDQANKYDANANALSFDPPMAQSWRNKARASQQLVRQIQNLLAEIN